MSTWLGPQQGRLVQLVDSGFTAQLGRNQLTSHTHPCVLEHAGDVAGLNMQKYVILGSTVSLLSVCLLSIVY